MYSFPIHEAAIADIDNVAAYTRTTHRSETGPNGWQHSFDYEYRDGRRVKLEGTFYDAVVFPASPGFQMLSFLRPIEGDPGTFDIEPAVHREPIIGWEIHSDEGYANVAPITTRGYCDQRYNCYFNAVRFPDGVVEWRDPWGEAYLRVEKAHGEQPGCIQSKDEAAWISKIREVWAAQIVDEWN